MDIKKVFITIPDNKRIIAISDIHGNLPIFLDLLKKVGFCDDDYLFILGDCINRGYHSLDTILYVMELSKKENVFVIKGNHEQDSSFSDGFYGSKSLAEYSKNEKSLIYEITKGVDVSTWNNEEIAKYAMEKYPEIFAYFHNLPYIIETQDYIFVHSAYFKENTIDSLLRTANYRKYDFISDKWIIVGHFPTANYPTKYFDCNPLIMNKNRIVFIDGGNGVKTYGQLNALIIDHGFKYEYTSDFKKYEVIEAQEEKGDVALSYLSPYVELLEEQEEFAKCQVDGKIVLFEKEYVYKENEKYNARNATNYFFPLEKGDYVEIVKKGLTVSLARRNGIVGYVYNRKIKEL